MGLFRVLESGNGNVNSNGSVEGITSVVEVVCVVEMSVFRNGLW